MAYKASFGRRATTVVVAGTLFLVNPYLACGGSSEPDFEYSEADMRGSVEGTWTGNVETDTGTTTFTLELSQTAMNAAQAASLRLEPACGNRSFFIRPAGACDSMSTMAVGGTLTTGDGIYDAEPVSGEYVVASRLLSGGWLYLTLASGGTLDLDQPDDDGVIVGGRLSAGAVERAVVVEQSPVLSP